ncbi:solanidine UDP-glucose glucosyltransferase 1 [Capsicum annuum]|uniref:solanidine UDP-glucose glucosyltransferase 1 n=1 Tax=Capsicum annuum TaxID=4072 RepID=UPI0007BEE752|nr:solanidine UDP-glucose glucosyltransferase 1 [Capsicum annuum]
MTSIINNFSFYYSSPISTPPVGSKITMAISKENGELLHVLFLPYLSAGHFIPTVNAARLFASCGVKATILTTPHNALLFQSTIDDDVRISGYNISIVTIKFPADEVGLPEGIESFNTATSPEMCHKIFHSLFLLQKPMEEKIREIRPGCIFSDMYYPWTVDLANELKIPRILYNLSAYMCYSIMHNLKLYRPHQQLKLEESQSFVVPGLPDKIEFKVSQLTEDLRNTPDGKKSVFEEILDQVRDSEDRSYGIVHDTYYELEPAYVDYYQKLRKPKCYHFGPISHFASKLRSKELIADHNSNFVVEWLNHQKPKSVLYVSFGSMARFPDNQLREIALALDASRVPFIFVLRPKQETSWLPDGFEERVVNTKIGLLIKGWVPQLTILEHSATGGFMTHCGTNSVLEAITSGVPMATWPLYADQFYNEKVVEVSGLGVKVGIEVWNSGLEITGPVIGSAQIREAIEKLMSYSEDIRIMRDKATAMSKMAKDAISEGGSSWNNLTELIEDIKNFTFSSTMA